MIRKIALAGAAGALALGSLAVLSAGTASAAKPVISAATSANVSCTFTAKAKISPALKNNWVQQPASPNPQVAALPDTKFSTDGPGSVSAKAKSIACTGTVSQDAVSSGVSAVKLDLVQNTPAVDNPPLQVDNTCAALLDGTQPGDVAATYKTTVKIKGTTAKINDAVITGSVITPATPVLGFNITGGSFSGSLAGGNQKALAYIDLATLSAFGAAPPTSAAPVPTNNKCQPTLKIKGGSKPAASLKPPKGLKKIAVGGEIGTGTPSNICFRKGSTCP